MGLKGEDIVDDSVWVVKTHSPWCMPFAPLFCANKIITVVRNPLAVIISWLNLVALANHNKKAPFEYEEKFPNWWNWWAKDCARLVGEWYKVMMADAAMRKVPVFWVRYERTVNNVAYLERFFKDVVIFSFNSHMHIPNSNAS